MIFVFAEAFISAVFRKNVCNLHSFLNFKIK